MKFEVKFSSFVVKEKTNKRLLTIMNKTGASEKSNTSFG